MSPVTHNPYRRTESGFIALMSAIVISVLLLAITLSLGFSGFFSRFNILDSESKERSSALAEACVDTAILNFSQNSLDVAFGTAPPVNVGSDQCKIMLVKNNPTGFPGKVLIKTQGSINKAFTDLKIQIDNTAFIVDSWEECPSLTSTPLPTTC